MRLLYNVLDAVSTKNQMELIKQLFLEKGWETQYRSTISVFEVSDDRYDAFLWFTLCTINHVGDAVPPYLFCHKAKAVYVTVEGVPTKANIIGTNLPSLEFITVSQFSKDCLEEAGLKVIDVIHHAIDWNKCGTLLPDAANIKKKWKEEYGDRTIFLVVGRNDPRKGLSKLSRAIDILNVKRPNDFVVLFLSSGLPIDYLTRPNVLELGQFGTMDYSMVLRFMGACDFGLFPSQCEGFGLPVLEHNAMGVPVLHCWFPPLTEFSSQDFNYVWDFYDRSLVNNAGYQYWVMHDYTPELLAEMMEGAIDTQKNHKDTYLDQCDKAREHAKAWDFKTIYPRLLSHLGVV
jgi:glycosyltransferase involved in cell wall biosynthesis